MRIHGSARLLSFGFLFLWGCVADTRGDGRDDGSRGTQNGLASAADKGAPDAPNTVDGDTETDAGAGCLPGADGGTANDGGEGPGHARDGGAAADAATDAGSPTDAALDAGPGKGTDAEAPESDAGADAGEDTDARKDVDAGADTDAGEAADAGESVDAGEDAERGDGGCVDPQAEGSLR